MLRGGTLMAQTLFSLTNNKNNPRAAATTAVKSPIVLDWKNTRKNKLRIIEQAGRERDKGLELLKRQ